MGSTLLSASAGGFRSDPKVAKSKIRDSGVVGRTFSSPTLVSQGLLGSGFPCGTARSKGPQERQNPEVRTLCEHRCKKVIVMCRKRRSDVEVLEEGQVRQVHGFCAVAAAICLYLFDMRALSTT